MSNQVDKLVKSAVNSFEEGAELVEKLFDVEKYSRFIYKITGTWEHPVVTNLSEGGAATTEPTQP